MQTSFTILRQYNGTSPLPTSSTLRRAEAENRLWKVAPPSRLYQAIETTCHVLLVLPSIGTVLYSVAMILSFR